MLSTSQDIQNASGTDGLGTLGTTLVSSLDYFSLAFAFSSHLSEMWNLTFGKGFVFVSYFWLMGHQALKNEGKAGDQLLFCKTGKNIVLLIVLLTVQHAWGILLVMRGLPDPCGEGEARQGRTRWWCDTETHCPGHSAWPCVHSVTDGAGSHGGLVVIIIGETPWPNADTLLFFLQRTILLCPRSLMNRQPTYPFPKVTFPKLFDRWWLGGQWFPLTIISSRVCSYITNIWRMRAFACGKVIENSFSYIFEGYLSADTCWEQIFDKFYHKGKFWLTLFD